MSSRIYGGFRGQATAKMYLAAGDDFFEAFFRFCPGAGGAYSLFRAPIVVRPLASVYSDAGNRRHRRGPSRRGNGSRHPHHIFHKVYNCRLRNRQKPQSDVEVLSNMVCLCNLVDGVGEALPV